MAKTVDIRDGVMKFIPTGGTPIRPTGFNLVDFKMNEKASLTEHADEGSGGATNIFAGNRAYSGRFKYGSANKYRHFIAGEAYDIAVYDDAAGSGADFVTATIFIEDAGDHVQLVKADSSNQYVREVTFKVDGQPGFNGSYATDPDA